MTTRRRPRKTITLDPAVIAYIENYATNHGDLDFSRATEAIIKAHANGINAALLAAAVGSTDPTAHTEHLPSLVRKPAQWTNH